MAISAVPYALQNGSHSADLFRQATSSFVPPGGGLVTAGDFAVTQTGTASMNVLVGVGRAWVPGTNVGNVTGGNFSKQAMYFALNDAAATVSVTTSDPTNPRIDVVYLAIQDSQYAGTTNTAVLGVATGVPTSGASYPTNAPTIPANAIALAWINVPANAPTILNSYLTNLAFTYNIRHAEFTSSSIAIPANTLYGPGAYTADTAQTVNGGFAAPDVADCIAIQPGLYQISFRVTGATAIPNGWLEIHSKDDATVYYGNTIAGVGTGGSGGVSVNLYFPAAVIIRLRVYLTTGWTMSATRARITKLA